MKTRLMILFGSALLVSFSLVMFFWSKAEAQESSSEEREAVEEESVPPQEMEPPLGAFDLLEPEETLLQEEEAEERPDSDLSAEQDEAEEDEEIEEESVDSESEEPEEFEIVGEEESSEDVSELSTSGAAGLEVESEKSETLTVDFAHEEVRTILRTVADVFMLNLVIPEALSGRISIKLHDVTWQQVFDVVLSPVGFTYVEEGNIIKVVSLESLSLVPPVTTVVVLNYAQAGEITKTLEPLLNTEQGGRIQVDKRSNALVITERPTQLEKIERIIEALDKPNAQVMIESKFIETQNQSLENIGINWASLDGYEVSAGPFEHLYERSRDRSHGRGRGETSESGQSNRAESTTPGSTSTETSSSSSQSSNANRTFERNKDVTSLTTAVFSADEFGLILSALRTTEDVKLVSNPTIVTMDNHPASIHIGEDRWIVLPRYNQMTGTYEAGQEERIKTGIKLNVTPQVNNAGFINLEVEPDVSRVIGYDEYFGAPFPIVSTRNAQSLVTVRDGYTVAIGGLVQEDTAALETRVPVLGSIPILGRLFRSDNNDVMQHNLIIFLTARTLSPDGTTIEDQLDPRMIHNMRIRRDEIPGYRPDIPMWPEEEEKKEEAAEEVLKTEEFEEPAEPAVSDQQEMPSVKIESYHAGADQRSEETESAFESETDSDVNGFELEQEVEGNEEASNPVRRRGGWLTP